MRIILTNDDGYDQPGLLELEKTLGAEHEVWVVAPMYHCSGISNAIGLYSEMELKKTGKRKWALDGTPTDCVKMALSELMKNTGPDLLVSGINPGANLANNVFYSGTVAAATEAALWNIPAVALSIQVSDPGDEPLFSTASAVLKRLLDAGLPSMIPPGTLVNVNVPNTKLREIRGVTWTRMGRFAEDIDFRRLESGRIFAYKRYKPLPVVDGRGTDVEALENFRVSLTLLDSTRTSIQKPPDLGAEILQP